jgi:hypothetical protein
MKNLDEFKDESLEINEQLASQGGEKKNDNSGRILNGEATGVDSTHPNGTDTDVTMANDDKSKGDTLRYPFIH